MKIIETRKKQDFSKAKEFFFKNYDPKKGINKAETAKSLGVTRQTIYNWIKEIEKGL